MQVVYQLLFLISIVSIFAMCAFTFWFVNRRPLPPFARNLLIILVILEIILAACHLMTFNSTLPPFLKWFFDLQYELNLGSIFSALQLFIIMAVTLIIAVNTPDLNRWQRAYWILLALVFLYLSLDEFYSFHETLGSRVPTEAWRVPYAIAGIILLGISALVWWFWYRKELAFFILLFAGIGVMTVSGIGIEEFVLQGFVTYNQSYAWMYVFEESFEMVGATIVLANLLGFSQRHSTEAQWPRTKWGMVIGVVVGLSLYTFSLALVPAIEARFFGNSIDVEYAEDELSLVGYYMHPNEIRPGDEMVMNLYWLAHAPLDEDYRLSVHLVERGTNRSLAQSDNLEMGPMPSEAMYPGIVMRRTIFLDVPENLPTPATYDVMVRVWSGPWPFLTPWEDTIGLNIASSEDRPLLASDAVLIDHVVAPPVGTVESLATTSDYQFADGFTLSGYQLPQETITSQSFPVSFQWSTQSQPTRDLTQFFHVVGEGDDAFFTFDQKPFSGTFPTNDWLAGITAVDQWTVTLPDEAPAGEYQIYSGLYDLETLERSAVSENGQAVQDNSILLGTIDYEPPQTRAEETSTPQDFLNYCYAVSNADLQTQTKDNDLFRVNRLTGEPQIIGRTGIYEAEALIWSLDGTKLYTIEKDNLSTFGTVDMQTGVFTGIGNISTIPDPARNPVFGTNTLDGPDSLALDPTTNRIWSVHENDDTSQNFLFEINPATGEVVRNTFAPQMDFIEIDISGIVGEDPDVVFTDIEEIAIDPRDGTFYIIASNDENFESILARIDFDTLNTDESTVQPVVIASLHTADDQTVHDMEGLGFFRDGTLYGMTSNNNGPNNDSLWEVDPQTGIVRLISSFRDYYEVADFESVACYLGDLEELP